LGMLEHQDQGERELGRVFLRRVEAWSKATRNGGCMAQIVRSVSWDRCILVAIADIAGYAPVDQTHPHPLTTTGIVPKLAPQSDRPRSIAREGQQS
jgi:hypothetical protein